jgi:rhamnogalacturonan endolyase
MSISSVPRLAALPLSFLLIFLSLRPASANIPGGGTGTGSNVTVTDNGATVTMANGILSVVITKSSATISTINYTYNNSGSPVTNPMLNGGTDGGELYWSGNPDWLGTESYSESVVANSGTYAEIDLLSTSASNGIMDIHYSMLKGSTGFYSTAILTHRNGDVSNYIQVRPNIYAGAEFNWMSVDAARNKLMAVSATNTSVAVPNAPKECYLWTSGPYTGHYEDKYKYTADMGTERVWGWSSVTAAGLTGSNVGMWIVSPSSEVYPGGPLERSLMEHIGTTMLNTFTGGYYGLSADGTIQANEPWTKTYGPYFVYCNNVSTSTTNAYQVSQALYTDAQAQAVAEESAWPYSWFNNSSFVPASGRGTVTGQIVISDSGNPNASASNLWVGVVQQPNTTYDTVYDFQEWIRPYEFWVQTGASGNFSIPNVIAGSNYTLYAFGTGAEGTFMSQAQTGGAPPILYNLPSTPFSVTVNGGTTTSLGTVTWTPTRVGPTVFEIGYPDRTARKFRHGDDYWAGDLGPGSSAPSPVWTKYLEYPFDFPNGPNYTVGSSRWSTDWNFIQPVVLSTADTWNNSSSNINFTVPSGTSLSGSASLYVGICSDFDAAIIVTVNNQNLGSVNGLSASPNSSVPTTGYYVAYGTSDTSIREGNNGAFTDERLTFPASILKSGTAINTINIGIRQTGGTYFADSALYDYIRLELAGYVPPAPGSVTAYPGNGSALVTWPVTPGATSYNISRSTTGGSGYASLATGVTGPVCGSGSANAIYLDTTASNGVPYYYEVQSANTTGTSASSPQSAAATPSSAFSSSAPAAPTGLAASATNGSVSLSWTASAGANYYTVQRSTLYDNGGGTYNTLGTITLSNTTSGTSYTDNTPTNGSTYSYAVIASNAAGSSGTSTSGTAEPRPPAPTTAPATVTATPGTEQVVLNWSAVSGAQGYILGYSTTSGGPYTYIASITPLTYTVTGLGDNTAYYFVISSVNEGGASGYSTEVSATTAPAAPTNVTAIPGNTQATLTWSAAANATGYLIQRGTASGGSYTEVGSTAGLTFDDTGLTNGSTYYYVINSTNSNGTSVDSSQVSATPSASLPAAPALTAGGGNQEVTLDWTSVAGATGYTILTGTQSGGPYSTLATVTGTTYTETGLRNGGSFYYVAYAKNSSGPGAYSNEANALTSNGTPILTWAGTASTAWDTVTRNWLYNGNAVPYTDGDDVVFPDTSSTSNVAVSGTVSPGSVTFNNSALNYAISGGIISGTGVETKSGSGSVTFSAANGFSGGLDLNGGSVTINGAGAAGSGALTMEQGTKFNMDDSSNATIVAAAGATATLTSTASSVYYSGTMSGPSESTLILSGTFSINDTGSAQFGGMYGLLDITPGSSFGFSSSSGANGNGGANATFQVDGSMYTRNAGGAGGIVLGGLSGAGSVSGQSNTTAGTDTYYIGSNNLSTTFSGAITNGGNGLTAIDKVGTGTLILTGDDSYTGATTVTAGILEIGGTLNGTSGITISGSGSYYQAGGELSVAGSITNNGIFKISGSPTITLTGAFTNNGVLDLINGSSTLPSGLVNHGTILTSSSATSLSQASLSGGTLSISMPSYVEHTYQLERATSLASPTWTAVGSSQMGTGSMLTLQDPAVSGSAAFYKVIVSP